MVRHDMCVNGVQMNTEPGKIRQTCTRDVGARSNIDSQCTTPTNSQYTRSARCSAASTGSRGPSTPSECKYYSRKWERYFTISVDELTKVNHKVGGSNPKRILVSSVSNEGREKEVMTRLQPNFPKVTFSDFNCVSIMKKPSNLVTLDEARSALTPRTISGPLTPTTVSQDNGASGNTRVHPVEGLILPGGNRKLPQPLNTAIPGGEPKLVNPKNTPQLVTPRNGITSQSTTPRNGITSQSTTPRNGITSQSTTPRNTLPSQSTTPRNKNHNVTLLPPVDKSKNITRSSSSSSCELLDTRPDKVKYKWLQSKLDKSAKRPRSQKKKKQKKGGSEDADHKKEIKKGRKRKELHDEARMRALTDPARMERLRSRFMEQCKRYFGVPYAKKYWTENDPEFKSKLFLDCCGLVRRVMRDLKKDFGFRIGPWNQGYMYDTLPVTIEKEADMKPGDLVFISAIYNSPKKKKQRHNMVHVEVWLGDGPKTIGARWNNGKVQVFDSYKFDSTSYHSPQYIFKSLDTWLMGICRSHCKDHKWKTTSERFQPTKRSIFSLERDKSDIQNQEPDEDASDSDGEATPRPDDVISRDEATPRPRGRDNDVLVIDCTEDDDVTDQSLGVYNQLNRNQLDNLVARQLERVPEGARTGADGFVDLGEISAPPRDVDAKVTPTQVDDGLEHVSSITSLDSLISLEDTSSCTSSQMTSSSRGSQTKAVTAQLTERDRLKVTCYASVANNDASVQINTPENVLVQVEDDGNLNNSNNDKTSKTGEVKDEDPPRFVPEAIRVYRQTYSQAPSPTSGVMEDDLGTS